jgi:hypothetical protein
MHQSELLPSRGDERDFIPRLVDYLSAFDTQWLTRTRAATDAQLEHYTRVSGTAAAGLSLPKNYENYLLHCGESDGGLLQSELLRATFSVTDVCELYLELEPDEINPELPIIGFYVATGETLAMDMRSRTVADPAIRYTGAGGHDRGMFSQSFEWFVFQRAFHFCQKRRFPHSVNSSSTGQSTSEALARCGNRTVFDVVEEIATAHAFVAAWFNDELNFAAARSDAAFHVVKWDDGAVAFSVYGDDLKFVKGLEHCLGHSLGGMPHPRRR